MSRARHSRVALGTAKAPRLRRDPARPPTAPRRPAVNDDSEDTDEGAWQQSSASEDKRGRRAGRASARAPVRQPSQRRAAEVARSGFAAGDDSDGTAEEAAEQGASRDEDASPERGDAPRAADGAAADAEDDNDEDGDEEALRSPRPARRGGATVRTSPYMAGNARALRQGSALQPRQVFDDEWGLRDASGALIEEGRRPGKGAEEGAGHEQAAADAAAPPAADEPPALMRWEEEELDLNEVDVILDAQPLSLPETFLVKVKGRSYRQLRWVARADLEPVRRQLVANFIKKVSEDEEFAAGLGCQDEWLEAERVLGESEEYERSVKRKVRYFLVKVRLGLGWMGRMGCLMDGPALQM